MSQRNSTCAHASLPCCPGVEFRIISGWPNYAAGDDGTIWSRIRNGSYRPGVTSNGWRQLQPGKCGKYAMVGLCGGDGKPHTQTVHTIILTTFKGPCPKGCVAAHNNGRARDCRLTNLRWDTHKENIADKKKHGTYLCGSQLSWTRLSESDVREIRNLIGTMSLAAIGRKFGVTRHNVASIRDGKSWSWLK
jgi:hypothetical protein